MSKSLGNYVGVTDAPGGDVRQADEHPRRGDGRVLPAAARREEPPAAPPNEAKRELAGGSSSASTARRGGGGAEAALQPALRRARGRPTRSRSSTWPPSSARTAARSTCRALIGRRLRDQLQRGAAPDRRRAGVKLDGEPSPPDTLDLRRRGARRAGSPGRQAALRAPSASELGLDKPSRRSAIFLGPSGAGPVRAPASRAASPVAEAQRSLKTEQRALRGPIQCPAECLSPIHSVRQRAGWSDLPRHAGRRTCVLGGH